MTQTRLRIDTSVARITATTPTYVLTRDVITSPSSLPTFFLLTETFHRRKPSETICPARVAVMLALSPAQSSATANKTAAAVCVRVCQIRVSLPAREFLGFSRMNELTFADT